MLLSANILCTNCERIVAAVPVGPQENASGKFGSILVLCDLYGSSVVSSEIDDSGSHCKRISSDPCRVT